MRASKWFTRGWTLQELIAPRVRVFYDGNWTKLNDIIAADDMFGLIEERTGIPRKILDKRQNLHSVKIATKMRWAAGRQTTREEDMAYSLLGLFDVQMSMLYGEGKTKAFVRLQKKLLKETSDQTIFAWTDHIEHSSRRYLQMRGMLAPSPEYFNVPGVDFEQMATYSFGSAFEPSRWRMTNEGLKITLHVTTKNHASGKLCAYLGLRDPKTGAVLSFQLYHIGGNKYARGSSLTKTGFDNHKLRKEVMVIPQGRTATQNVPSIALVWSQDDSHRMLGATLVSALGEWSYRFGALVCDDPHQQSGFYTASVKVKVKPAHVETRHDNRTTITIMQDRAIFFITCHLQWNPEKDLWKAWCIVSPERASKSLPDTSPADDLAAETKSSECSAQGYTATAEYYSVHSWDENRIQVDISLRNPSLEERKPKLKTAHGHRPPPSKSQHTTSC